MDRDAATRGTATLGAELYRSLADLRREVRRTVRSGFPAQLLTPSQVEVLGCVRRQPGIGVRDAATALRLAPNTVSTIVGHLVDLGLLRRDADPDDARAVCLRLTAAGERRLFHGILLPLGDRRGQLGWRDVVHFPAGPLIGPFHRRVGFRTGVEDT